MKNFDFKKVKLRGDISHRILINYNRLESGYYTPDYIFTADISGWPGDWEGRTMLALIRLSEASGKEPSYLDEIMEKMDGKLNEKGYFGKIQPAEVFDEQQLSGNNWFLRALLEYYRIYQFDHVYIKIEALIQNLYLPAKGFYGTYPLEPDVRGRTGKYDGHITGKNGNWYTSSDIGCAFMCLDGLSMAYEMFKQQNVKELLDEMISVFCSIDFIGSSMQTHATLSATRGIIRMYNATGDKKYLDIALRIYGLYLENGMTENYANQNWFNRPTTWTEPCAIVDSYMCAVELFKITGEIKYLELSHKIYYNALGHAQRPTGGFGCDVCVGFNTEYISPHSKGLCEAVWCCTMRGGEGLAECAKNIFAYDDKGIYLLNYNAAQLNTGKLKIDILTEYPFEGKARLKIDNNDEDVKLFIFVPSYVENTDFQLIIDGEKAINLKFENGFVELVAEKGKHIAEISFNIPLIKAPTFMPMAAKDLHTFSHGFLIVGCETKYILAIKDADSLSYIGKGKYQLDTKTILAPINDVIYMEDEDVANSLRQILFR